MRLWIEHERDPDRIREMCEMFKEAWEKVPDQRFGQFLLNYVFEKKDIKDSVTELGDEIRGHYPDKTNSLMFDQEDDITFEILEALSHDSVHFSHKTRIKKEMEK